MEGWSADRVLGLAPDASSTGAGRKLATPGPWSETGRDDRAVWGLCRGSGKKPYEVQVDLSEPAFKCSCPSRKFPCKHALGLLLLAVEQPREVPEGEPPERVTAWLGSRDERAGKAAERREARTDGPADPEAAAKRAARRAERTAAGIAELRRWLEDVVRGGLGALQQQPYGFFDRVAARMVDAQAPGVASRIRRLAGIAFARQDTWAARMLEELGLLYLLVEAHDRLGTLPEATQADVRSQLGWPVSSEEILAGPTERGRWTVAARVVEEQDRLRVQRTWLVGDDGRPALLLDFAPPGGALDLTLATGTVVDADLAFYPSAAPLRALVAVKHDERAAREPCGDATLSAALARRAAALAANPWIDRWPLALSSATPVVAGDGWALRTDGESVPLAIGYGAASRLLAVSGGSPVGVTGEWERGRLRPLAVHAEGRTVEL